MKKLLLVLALACGFTAVASAQCRDPWVSQAVSQVMGRAAQGQGDTGECSPSNYNNGQWSSYQQLVSAVSLHFTGTCKDPWVTSAVRAVKGQIYGNPLPDGYGTYGECNPALYGNGQWSSYPDLMNKVQAHFRAQAAPAQPQPAQAQPQQGVCNDAWVTQAVRQVTGRAPSGYGNYGDCYIGNYGGGQWSSYQDLVNKVSAHFRPPAPAPAPVLSAPSGYRTPPPATVAPQSRFVGQNGYPIVASGAGNFQGNQIVASGAGNYRGNQIVASGAGNFYQRGGDDMKLAESGDPQAMYHVGQKFAAEGKDQNLPEAYRWLSLAVENGVSDAADERKAVREKLTEDQVKQINAEVKDWKPTPVEAPQTSAPPADAPQAPAPSSGDSAEKK